MIPIDLGGRVILVCGVSRGGIGGATARRLSEAGATIFAVDHSQQMIDETVADVEKAGGTCHGMVADLMDAAQSDLVVRSATAKFGRLDGVANVAGGTREHDWMCLEETPINIFRETILLNLEYVFRICRDAASYMIDNKIGGSMVNVSSISGLASAPFHGPYGAAKSGIVALTKTMSIEWRPHGIRANAVSPGAVATQRVLSRMTADEETMKSIVAGFTTPDELACGILFLLSDLASGISGQNLTIDSSLSAKFCAGDVELRRPEMLAAKAARQEAAAR